jgi:hypothetical protein
MRERDTEDFLGTQSDRVNDGLEIRNKNYENRQANRGNADNTVNEKAAEEGAMKGLKEFDFWSGVSQITRQIMREITARSFILLLPELR